MRHDTSQLLMRYVDDDVTADERVRAEQLLINDGEARAEVDAMRQYDALLGAAFDTPADRAALVRHEAIVDVGFARRGARHSRLDLGPWMMPLAASIAMALVVGVGGFWLAEQRIDAAVERVIAAQAQDRLLMASALQNALENRVSGEAMAWNNPDSGSTGAVTPLRTFRSVAGSWCREFEKVLASTAASEASQGIACRSDDGRWRIAAERPKDV